MGILSTGKGSVRGVGPFPHKVCRGSEGVKLKAVLKNDGFNILAGVGVLVPGQIHA